MKFSFLSLLLLVLFPVQISFAGEPAEVLARKAASENTAEATPALEELRSKGPAGLRILMTQYAHEINWRVSNPNAPSDEHWQRISAALDTVAQQKNSYVAGLYWHTDLESAKKASAASGKPILSLRLLGKLTDEFSCANSRFFRTVLYSNADVSSYLREDYVLHWQSVRPVPTVTIDFGDGRKLERTLTGNSIHYILDAEGRPIDALPGLYGPKAFQCRLINAEGIFHTIHGKPDHYREPLLMSYHRNQHRKIVNDWTLDTTTIGGKIPGGFVIEKGANGEALSIAPLAVTKAVTETTILRAMTTVTDALGQVTDEAAWKKIAGLHSNLGTLDERSIALIKRQNPTLSNEEMPRLLKKFQDLIVLDTVRNEYLLHSKLYMWLMRDPARHDVEKLNEKVYAKLFLTPHSDPWLGLFSTDVYTALDNGGVVNP
jgi:hypothetical protein